MLTSTPRDQSKLNSFSVHITHQERVSGVLGDAPGRGVVGPASMPSSPGPRPAALRSGGINATGSSRTLTALTSVGHAAGAATTALAAWAAWWSGRRHTGQRGSMAAVGSGRVRAGPALMSSAGGGASSRGGAGLPIAAARTATPPKATAATACAAVAAVAAVAVAAARGGCPAGGGAAAARGGAAGAACLGSSAKC